MGSLWTLPILAYHRIGEPKGDHVPTVTPESFERQLACLARQRVTVVSLEALVDSLREGNPLRGRRAVITFDDGYEDTSGVAATLLRRFGFCATVFVTPNEIGLPGFMTWDQVRSVAQDGMTVGSHTLHHAFLPLLSRDKIEHELVESKRIIEQQIGRPVNWLSYPVGGFTPEVQDVARAAGYRAACTTNRGMSKRAVDLFALRRIKMTEMDRHSLSLRAKLSGYYDCFRRLEQPA